MYQASKALFFYAETSVHLGSGGSVGSIDLAIQRERYTGFPCGAAQGIKGAIRDWFERVHGAENDRVLSAFGPNTDNASDHAGAVAFTDARILLFPVKSLKGVFAWITCPMVLGRFRRDLGLANEQTALAAWKWENISGTDAFPASDNVLGATSTHSCRTEHSKVILEEEPLEFQADDSVKALANWLKDHAFPQSAEYTYWRESLASKLLVVSDDDFTHFVKTSTEIQARIKLGPKKTTTDGGNLFYQENLPGDSVMYTLVLAANDFSNKLDVQEQPAKAILDFIVKGTANNKSGLQGQRLQIGGDETTGKGYVCAHFMMAQDNAGAPGNQEVAQ